RAPLPRAISRALVPEEGAASRSGGRSPWRSTAGRGPGCPGRARESRDTIGALPHRPAPREPAILGRSGYAPRSPKGEGGGGALPTDGARPVLFVEPLLEGCEVFEKTRRVHTSLSR